MPYTLSMLTSSVPDGWVVIIHWLWERMGALQSRGVRGQALSPVLGPLCTFLAVAVQNQGPADPSG